GCTADPAGAGRRRGRVRVGVLAAQAAGRADRRRLWRGHRAGRGRDAVSLLHPLSRLRGHRAASLPRRLGLERRRNGDFRDMLLRSLGMAAPAIVHIEFKSSDFARTSAFYAKLFDWRTEQNGSGSYMKADSADGPSGGRGGARRRQSPPPAGPPPDNGPPATPAQLARARAAARRRTPH